MPIRAFLEIRGYELQPRLDKRATDSRKNADRDQPIRAFLEIRGYEPQL